MRRPILMLGERQAARCSPLRAGRRSAIGRCSLCTPPRRPTLVPGLPDPGVTGDVTMLLGYSARVLAAAACLLVSNSVGHAQQVSEFPANPTRFDPYKATKFRVKWDGIWQVVLAYNLFRCWPFFYQASPQLDANANLVAVEAMTLACEAWERDAATVEPVEPSAPAPPAH